MPGARLAPYMSSEGLFTDVWTLRMFICFGQCHILHLWYFQVDTASEMEELDADSISLMPEPGSQGPAKLQVFLARYRYWLLSCGLRAYLMVVCLTLHWDSPQLEVDIRLYLISPRNFLRCSISCTNKSKVLGLGKWEQSSLVVEWTALHETLIWIWCGVKNRVRVGTLLEILHFSRAA